MTSTTWNHIRIVAFAITIATLGNSVDCYAQSIQPPPPRPLDLPRTVTWVRTLSDDACDTFRDGRTLWLVPNDASLKAKRCSIPRLCASLTSIGWSDPSKQAIHFKPEPEHWDFTWKESAPKNARIKVVFEKEPVLPSQSEPAAPAADGSIMLHADQAKTVGKKLRFEPQWFKNTVGYWAVPTDYATWNLQFAEAGEYSVAILQGCGSGQAGSDALISLRHQESVVAELPFRTIDTGHFQNFRWNHLGRISVAKAGTYQLQINAVRISKAALCDIRSIHLVKQAK
ncbi:MAG: hypothetical protein ABJZ55_18925 [Fuerstiella sp.]